eukprot:GEMP01053838.1.p1 GENE.GEMP01053838.1~~GEMP01053838.1.p1  ORF type:complete len:329 (+),score=68.53 GEMP01053838.1:210-1196(+)
MCRLSTKRADKLFSYLECPSKRGVIEAFALEWLGLPYSNAPDTPDRRPLVHTKYFPSPRRRAFPKSRAGSAHITPCGARPSSAVQLTPVDGFNKLLRRRYGNVVRAWRLALVEKYDGTLSFMHFCYRARQLGLEGNLRTTWKMLQHAVPTDENPACGNNNNSDPMSRGITLDALDPLGAADLGKFREFLQADFRTLEGAWALWQTDRGLRVGMCGFEAPLIQLGFSKALARRLFSYLESDTRPNNVTIAEIAWLGLPSVAPSPTTNGQPRMDDDSAVNTRIGYVSSHAERRQCMTNPEPKASDSFYSAFQRRYGHGLNPDGPKSLMDF